MSSTLVDSTPNDSTQVLMLPVDELFANSSQPRKSFDKEEINRMAASVRARGILQPIRVRRDESRGGWEIITGETRWRGAKQAGLTHVPCLPVTAALSDTEVLADQLIENLVRNALHPMELSHGFAKYRALRNCNGQTMAAELGVSGSTVTKVESLLTLPEEVQKLIDSGKVSIESGYLISRLPTPEEQLRLAYEVANGKVTNRDATAEAVRAVVGSQKPRARPGRFACKVADAGLAVTVSALGREVTADDLRKASEQLRREEKKFNERKEMNGSVKAVQVS